MIPLDLIINPENSLAGYCGRGCSMPIIKGDNMRASSLLGQGIVQPLRVQCGGGWVSIKKIMINPFISNNDSNYLFRKNYQFIAKPQPPPPSTSFSSSKLNFLQSKNPFTPPPTPIISPPVPSRSLSNSRVAIGSSSRDKLLLGKSRMIDEADGWKRELQSQERVKLQAYGAEGLRYNAYSPYTDSHYDSKPQQTRRYGERQQPNNIKESAQFNDYYTSYTKPIEIKAPKPIRDSGHQPHPELRSERNDYYQQPQQQLHPQPSFPSPRRNKEHFTDDINEEDEQQQFMGTGRKERSKYELDIYPIREEESQRRSKLDDMFGSEMMESMQHHSYASYYPNDLVQSKHSKFREPVRTKNSYLYESNVNRFEAIGPPSFTLSGKIYYKIEV